MAATANGLLYADDQAGDQAQLETESVRRAAVLFPTEKGRRAPGVLRSKAAQLSYVGLFSDAGQSHFGESVGGKTGYGNWLFGFHLSFYWEVKHMPASASLSSLNSCLGRRIFVLPATLSDVFASVTQLFLFWNLGRV